MRKVTDLASIGERDLVASLRPIATLRTSIEELAGKGIRFAESETNLGLAQTALLEADGLQFALVRENERPRTLEVEVLASETADAGSALDTVLRAVGLPSALVTWRLDATLGAPTARRRPSPEH